MCDWVESHIFTTSSGYPEKKKKTDKIKMAFNPCDDDP